MTEQLLERPSASAADRESGDMSSHTAQQTPTAEAWGTSAEVSDFDFTPMSPWGPIALILGLASTSAFLGTFGMMLAGFSTLIGLAAVSRIRASAGMYRGSGL
ncbi:MAG: hypothetical protein KDA85_13925, partial [Planctomycetaceae bacterium]|nr:hypothetical protein [Planctomycetaceae bacterium]